MKKAIIFLSFLVFSGAACANNVNGVWTPAGLASVETAQKFGYHDIQILSEDGRKCPDGVINFSHVDFRAISADNHIVTGYTCNGKVYLLTQSKTEIKNVID
jgi:hypothetical protein